MSFSSSKLFEDDDEDLSGSSRKTNLGSLFGASTQAPSKDSSLAYQRPKAPTKSDVGASKSASKSGLPALLHTTKVDLYKNGTNPPEYAQVGAAITENSTGATKFNMLLYYTREKVITMVPITREFVLTLQLQDGVHFGSFYDGAQKLWSFRFLKAEDAEQMAIYMTIAKHHEEPGQVWTQELGAATKGTGAVKDDILGVRYVSYSEKLGKLSDPLDDNTGKPQPAKYIVGSASNKAGFPGWEIGLDGLKRGGRRILLVPNDSGDGPTMIYKLHLEKMKKAVPESAPTSGKLPKPDLSTDASSQQNPSSDASEPGSPVSDNSNAILQRMSKMAVATPFAGANVKSSLTPSDSDAQATTHHDSTTQSGSAGDASASSQPSSQQQQQTQPMQSQQASTQQPQQQQPFQQQQQQQFQPQQQMPYQQQQQQMFGPNGMPMGPQGYSGQFGMNAFGAGAPGAGAYGMYGGAQQNAAALSLYNPQQQQTLWDMQHGIWPGANPQAAAVAAAMAAQQQQQQQQQKSEKETSAASSSAAHGESVLSQAEAIQLLIDGRQFQSEIKSSLTKMSSQLEDVEERLEGTMFTKNKDLGGGVTAKVLLQTVSRIVGENDRMLEELAARDERIDQLTSKLNKLHETNQRVIDENNRFMEERTSTFKTATDSQLRQLESWREEKTALEMELTSANRQFQTLKRSHTNVTTELETLKEEMERLKTDRDMAVSKYAGVAGASQSAEAKLLDEQSAKRKLELDVQQLRDELTSEKEMVENMRRDAEDRKTRVAREMANMAQDHASEKAVLEEQVAKLQETLRKEKAALGASSEQAQAEIESKWSARFQADLQRAQSALEASWEAKFEQHRATVEQEARDRVKALKEAHEEQLSTAATDLETERTTWREREQAYRRNISQLQEVALSSSEAQEVISRLKAELSEIAQTNAATIKSIMNNVYMSLNDLFDDGESVQYDKSGIMDTLKKTIVSTTKKLINPDEEVAPIDKPAPVAPVRIEVPVTVEVPVSASDASPAAEVASTSEPAAESVSEEPKHEEVDHVVVEEPVLERVDSEVSVSTMIKDAADDAAPVVAQAPVDSEEEDIDDPLAPKKEKDEDDDEVAPAVPVDDGWEPLPEDEPGFVQPVEEEKKKEDEEKVEATVVAPEDGFDPLSEPTSPAVPARSADDDEPVVTEPSNDVEEEKKDEPSTDAVVEEQDVAQNPLSKSNVSVDDITGSVDESEAESTHKDSAPHVTVDEDAAEAKTEVEAGASLDLDTEDSIDIDQVTPKSSQHASESATPQVERHETAEEDATAAATEEPTSSAPADAEESTANVASPLDATDNDDDPFGVDEKKVEEPTVSIAIVPEEEEAAAPKAAAPAPAEEDDDDPFGVNEPKSPAPTSTAAANGSTPMKKPSMFDDDDDDSFSTPKSAATSTAAAADVSTPADTSSSVTAPATEPKKKASSLFDDDEDDMPIVPKKAPASASKAFSFGDDDDDSFGVRKPSSSKKSDALDDIFGGISSKDSPSSSKKGLFDD